VRKEGREGRGAQLGSVDGRRRVASGGHDGREGGERGRGERKRFTTTCSMRWLRHVGSIDTSAKSPAKQL